MTALGCWAPIMRLRSREEAILEEAFAGVSRVAEAIASLRTKDSLRAFDAAERSYRKTAEALGYTEGQARGWAASLMVRLRAEVAAIVEATIGKLEEVA